MPPTQPAPQLWQWPVYPLIVVVFPVVFLLSSDPDAVSVVDVALLCTLNGVFSEVFGAQTPLLPNRSFRQTWSRPEQLDDVTAQVHR